ncbi:DNA-damage-inducible protein J [Clostridia bacterium]|nr:DNA-damage-inducible protein J [Clostridia bacterium]
MVKKTTIQIRTDVDVKVAADAIFKQLGVHMSDAINIFLRQSIIHGGLPFEVKVSKPNEITLAAMEDIEQAIKDGVSGFDNFEEFLSELKRD